MPTTIGPFNGTTYQDPLQGEVGWHNQVSALLQDLANNAVDKNTGQTVANKTLVNPFISGLLSLPTGTAAAPTLTFVGNTGSGLFSPVSGQLGVAASGVEGVRITGVASAVNTLQLTPSVTGSNPVLTVQGTDANIGITISPVGTGSVTINGTTNINVPTQTQGNNSNKAASTAYVDLGLASTAPINNPAFTGIPTAPTPATGVNTTQIATTAFVNATAMATVLPAQAGHAGQYITTDGTNAYWGAFINLNTYQSFSGY